MAVLEINKAHEKVAGRRVDPAGIGAPWIGQHRWPSQSVSCGLIVTTLALPHTYRSSSRRA